MQGIRPDHPLSPVSPLRAPAQPLHASPLSVTQLISRPLGAPRWSRGHIYRLKDTQGSRTWAAAFGTDPDP